MIESAVPTRFDERRAVARQADTDEQLLELWLHGRPDTTRGAYAADARRLRAFLGKPLGMATLADVQAFADSLDGLAPATRARILSVVKSLYSFAHRLGYCPFNTAAPIRAPKLRSTRAERILPESAVHTL